jgi:hypothetical protein
MTGGTQLVSDGVDAIGQPLNVVKQDDLGHCDSSLLNDPEDWNNRER